MASDPKGSKHVLLPFSLLTTADGIVLKRGATEVTIAGEGAAAFVDVVREATAGGATREEICAHFPPPDRAVVDHLLSELAKSRLLVETDGPAGTPREAENTLDVFYWQFGDSSRRATEALNRAAVVVVGVNSVSRQIVQSMLASGVTSLTVVDDPRLRNAGPFERIGPWPAGAPKVVDPDEWKASTPASPPCVVATCDFGNQQTLMEWNAFCVERGHRFLPVFLQNSVGYVGPFVVPGETACFACLRTRWNAQIDRTETLRAVDGLTLGGEAVVGFHPAMPSVLGDVAAFELTKLHVRVLPNPRIGTQIEINLLVPRMTARRILKDPRCRTCSPLRSGRPVSAGT